MTETIIIKNPSPGLLRFVEMMRVKQQEQLKMLAEAECQVKITVD